MCHHEFTVRDNSTKKKRKPKGIQVNRVPTSHQWGTILFLVQLKCLLNCKRWMSQQHQPNERNMYESIMSMLMIDNKQTFLSGWRECSFTSIFFFFRCWLLAEYPVTATEQGIQSQLASQEKRANYRVCCWQPFAQLIFMRLFDVWPWNKKQTEKKYE